MLLATRRRPLGQIQALPQKRQSCLEIHSVRHNMSVSEQRTSQRFVLRDVPGHAQRLLRGLQDGPSAHRPASSRRMNGRGQRNGQAGRRAVRASSQDRFRQSFEAHL